MGLEFRVLRTNPFGYRELQNRDAYNCSGFSLLYFEKELEVYLWGAAGGGKLLLRSPIGKLQSLRDLEPQ